MGYSPWGHKRVRHALATKQQQSIVYNSMKFQICTDVPNRGYNQLEHFPYLKKKPKDFPWWSCSKESPADAGDTGSVPGLRRFHTPWGNEAHAPQPLGPHSGAQVPHLPRPTHPRARAPQ